MPTRVAMKDLVRELGEYRERYSKLQSDDLFLLWFLRAFITDSEVDAIRSLAGGPRDKSVDAVFIDDAAKVVFLVQGKFRKEVMKKSESRNDVLGFAHLAPPLCGDAKAFANLMEDMSPEVQGKLADARGRIIQRAYSLSLFYVTTGKCSANVVQEATRVVRAVPQPASFQLFDGRRILLLLADYFDGVAPPVPSLDLEIEAGGGVRTGIIFNRYDAQADIESWAFGMTDTSIAGLYRHAGTRLFARNVRGFLGSTEINRGMQETIRSEPEYFWYYNNGITIVCDEAKQESSRGRNVLRVTNPQVINGQQTTRALAKSVGRGPRASVLVRVIRVPRAKNGGDSRFETLVSKIVAATNWQNAIRPSDLMSNDRRQIEIERQFRKLDYLYVRKRTTKGEARRMAGGRHLRLVKKEEIAQAVAGCDFDPAIVRGGKEKLFEERWYLQIFPSTDPRYYLSRYRLMRDVAYAARGYPERAYAKWLVVNFLWRHLEPVCRSVSRGDAYRKGSEKGKGDGVKYLLKASNLVFTAALSFYRKNRGHGATAIDVSAFFQRRKLDAEFRRYWVSSANLQRHAFKAQWTKFEKAIVAAAKA